MRALQSSVAELSIRFIITISFKHPKRLSTLTEPLSSLLRDRVLQNCGQRRRHRTSTYAKIVLRHLKSDEISELSEFRSTVVVPQTLTPRFPILDVRI